MPFEVFNVSDYIRKTCEEDPKLQDLYIKMQPDEKIMRTFAGFRKDLTFKEKAKLLGFKKKKLQRIVADDIDSVKLKDLKKLADGMGKTLRIEFVPKEQSIREFMDELMEESGENMNDMQNQELCILLDSILALLETDNVEKAKEVIQNAINRIDRGMTTSTKE